jgi:hypothetical protein
MRPASERPDAARGDIVCPDCQTTSPAGTQHCPECGFPLALHAPAAGQAAVDPGLYAKPGDAPIADATFILPGAGGLRPPEILGPAPELGATICPSCGRPNEAGQERWCEWCGADMRPPVRAALPEPPPIRPRPPRRNWGFLLGGAAMAAVLVIVAWVVVSGGDEETGPTVKPDEPAAVAVIAPGRITAEASSTIKQSKNKFSIQNTLDGREDTAWNSDGEKVGTGRGVTLTYRFDSPVDLRSMTLRNGYVRSPELGAESYGLNGRIREVLVRTDAGERTWRLEDTPEVQTFDPPVGQTSQVQLIVQKVYRGSKFKDLAVTDIAFSGVG